MRAGGVGPPSDPQGAPKKEARSKNFRCKAPEEKPLPLGESRELPRVGLDVPWQEVRDGPDLPPKNRTPSSY